MSGVYKPTPRECALLLLRVFESRNEERSQPVTRARLSELTLKRLWLRQRLTREFLAEVEEWLLSAGWALLFAGSTYAAIKVAAVENWPRLSSKRIADELATVSKGEFDFAAWVHLLDTTDVEDTASADDPTDE